MQITATVAIIARIAPDVLVLTDHDYDLTGAAATALTDLLTSAGQTYPYRFALAPSSGMATGLDLDGNDRLGEARDAMGYGLFAGDGGLLILSKLPLDNANARDFSTLLWRDLPGATLPQQGDAPFPSADVQAMLRLSSVAHWAVPVLADPPFTLLVSSSAPPVFDGPEDMNGLRNRDQLRLWSLYLDGAFGPPPASFVFAGNTNLDPADGDGLRDAMAAFLADPRLKDPMPASAGGQAVADPGQTGDPARDTADWPDGRPGNLRVSYVLPSTDWRVAGAGVFWPTPDHPDAALLGSDGLAAGPHHLVWVDIVR